MAARKITDPGQTLARADRLIDLSQCNLASANELRRGELHCPRCDSLLSITLTPTGPLALHRSPAGHEPEDTISWKQRQLLRARMQEIFEGALVQADVEVGRELGLGTLWCDLVLITGTGARILVFVWGRAEHTKAELEDLRAALAAAGLHALFLIDGSRLAKRPQETKVMGVTLKKLETALLAASQPLIYLGPEPRAVYRVYVPAIVRAYAEAEKVNSVGRLKTACRRYQLSQLRVREGAWAIDTTRYDRPLPAPPPLPDRLKAKLNAQLLAAE